ncbi:MAG TPA: DUF6585 family protein [Ktedonobacteraceae bacterium]|nr:DUF6585 family protein [Ktedonobacteraceae bacterium]
MTQTMQTMPGQRVPGEIYQQAAMNGLGDLVAAYKPRYTNPFFIIGLALVILVVDIIAVVVIYEIGFIVYYLVAVPIIAIIWAIGTLSYCNLRVYIFTNGFIRARGVKGDVVRWDQVQAIWERVRQSRSGGTFIYNVQRNDGRVFVLGSPLQNSRDMGLRMMREITRLHLPAAQAAYNAGQTLSFGKVNVNAQGLNNGKELVPWDQIGRLTTKQGKLCIEKNGRQIVWSSVKSSEVPNLSVLIALVNYVVQGQR